MNDDERARQTTIAVRLLEEAVYDALQSAHANGEGALQPRACGQITTDACLTVLFYKENSATA